MIRLEKLIKTNKFLQVIRERTDPLTDNLSVKILYESLSLWIGLTKSNLNFEYYYFRTQLLWRDSKSAKLEKANTYKKES